MLAPASITSPKTRHVRPARPTYAWATPISLYAFAAPSAILDRLTGISLPSVAGDEK